MVANAEESAVLNFLISNAVPTVLTSNISWYYTSSAPSGEPDFSSSDFQDITNLTNRTSSSMLQFSADRLALTIGNIVQAIGDSVETDQGRYFMSASNPAGESSAFIDLLVDGKL